MARTTYVNEYENYNWEDMTNEFKNFMKMPMQFITHFKENSFKNHFFLTQLEVYTKQYPEISKSAL